MRGASSAWVSSRPGREACPCSSRTASACGARPRRLAARRPRAAADGRLRARQPDVVGDVALVPPAPRRPLPRARRRPGLDGALGAHRPARVCAAGRRSRPDPRCVRGRRPRRRRGARLGRPDRARLGARSPGAGARDPARQHRRRDAARRRAAADPLRAPRAAARPRLPADLGLSADDAGDSARADREGGEERVSRAVRVERTTGRRSPTSSPTSRRLLPIRRIAPLAAVADRLPS